MKQIIYDFHGLFIHWFPVYSKSLVFGVFMIALEQQVSNQIAVQVWDQMARKEGINTKQKINFRQWKEKVKK